MKDADLAVDSLLLRHLLNWFNFDERGDAPAVLALLARLATQPRGASRLL